MNSLAVLLVAVVSSGLTYLGLAQAGLIVTHGPQTITPEIKAYIDSQLKEPKAGAGTDEAKLMGRVADIEKKLGDFEKAQLSAETLAKKSEAIESAILEQRKKQQDLIAGARDREVVLLGQQMATVCAGVRVQKDKSAR